MKTELHSCGNILTLYHRHPHIAHCAAIAAFIALLYCKVIGHEFLINWDDVDYITQNPLIQKLNIVNLKQIFSAPYNGNYAPLHILSYLFDYMIWGFNPAAFKLENVFFHAACSILFYCLLRRLGLSDLGAFVAALLFAIHPVQVESVAWASQRKNTLSLLFFLAAWFTWDLWNKGDGSQKRQWYILSLIFFSLALCSKPIAVVLPVVLLTQEWALNRHKITINSVRWLVPYLLLLGGFITITVFAHDTSGGGTVPYHGGSFAITAINMLPVFARYFALIFMPTDLNIIYNAPLKYLPDASIIASGLFVLFFFAVLLWLSRRNSAYFFWLSVFVIGLLPVANIVPITTLMNDRYLYFPMLGITPFVVLAGTDALHAFKINARILTAIVTLLITVTLSYLTWNQVDVWKNSLTLWENAFAKAPPGTWYEKSTNTDFIKEGYVESLIVEATNLHAAGKLAEAKQYCLTALSLAPSNYNALGLVADILMQDKKPLEARPYLLQLVSIFPGSEAAHYYLGQNYAMTGENENATKQLKIVIGINPDHTRALHLIKELSHASAVNRKPLLAP